MAPPPPAPAAGGAATAAGGEPAAPAAPVEVTVRVKPFPWPPRWEDLGAASAAAFLNLLLVYAFLAPTRAVVVDVVREKELRLREGMRILGLTVRAGLVVDPAICPHLV